MKVRYDYADLGEVIRIWRGGVIFFFWGAYGFIMGGSGRRPVILCTVYREYVCKVRDHGD